MVSIADALLPLEHKHLGILARCFAASPPSLRAADAAALIHTTFGEEVSIQDVEHIFANLQQTCPELLGGPPLELQGLLGESTLVSPAITACPLCCRALSLGPPRPAKAFCLHRGWIDVRYEVATCKPCNSEFSNVWHRRLEPGARCACVASPADAAFFQIVACPRKNSKAFIEVRTLWLLRAALLRCKAPFGGFVEMLADLHGAVADREHDSLRFEHHWLMFETLVLLFDNEDTALWRSDIWWPLDTRHEPSIFQQLLLQDVLPPLRALLRKLHFQEHVCDTCRSPVVTFDAKYGLTCRLCNHREGGVVRFESIQCNVMFGCQNPPMQSSLYCAQHDIGLQASGADGPQILRHRDDNGTRVYKIEGQSAWQPRAALPARAVARYEALLAERTERRKKRRGHAQDRASSTQAVADPEDGEAEFFDTDEPAMRLQPTEPNPCGINKADVQPRRKYGGLLISTLPCGRVCGATPLAHAESLTQVYALMSSLHELSPDRLRFVFYDNACALARYARHPGRAQRTQAAVALSQLTYVLDSFHVANHSACLDPNSSYHLPEVLRGQHPQLSGVNSQTAEQFFAWVDPFVRSVVGMTPAVFEVFLLLLTHVYNISICGSSSRPFKPRPRQRPQPPSIPRRAAPEDGAPAPEARPSSPPTSAPPPPTATLRRNPNGVGLWGAGKYHWQPDDASATRPPCKIVEFSTLSESRATSLDLVQFLPQIGYVLVTPDGKHELCKLCARAMTRAGFFCGRPA